GRETADSDRRWCRDHRCEWPREGPLRRRRTAERWLPWLLHATRRERRRACGEVMDRPVTARPSIEPQQRGRTGVSHRAFFAAIRGQFDRRLVRRRDGRAPGRRG